MKEDFFDLVSVAGWLTLAYAIAFVIGALLVKLAELVNGPI